MADDILRIQSPIVQSDKITSLQYHTYAPYTTAFNNNDEIRIALQAQDLYILPSESFLQIEFTVTDIDNARVQAALAVVQQADPNARLQVHFIHGFIAHLFSEIRYELNGIEIDKCRSPGITSLLKCMTAIKSSDLSAYKLMTIYTDEAIALRSYRMILPIRFVLGFFDDYSKIILNSKHELIMVRARSDQNVYIAPAELANFNVDKIQWKVQHVTLSDAAKLNMLKTMNRNDFLPLPYRSWDLYEMPALPQTNRHTWSIKTTTQTTKPRYILLAFQTDRNFRPNKDMSKFDHCNITNIQLYMNNDRYPYDDLNINFASGKYHELSHMQTKIQKSYYNNEHCDYPSTPTYPEFAARPIFAFDCSRSDETVKSGMVDIRVEIEASANIPEGTAAYCLIIHDNLVWYSPFSSIVYREI